MITVILLLSHALVAIALVGAITHQTLSMWRGALRPARSFLGRFRAVPAPGYANAVIALYVVTFTLGAIIYPQFVLNVKSMLIETGYRYTLGVFQLKEHLVVIGLALLPLYWHLWRQVPLNEHIATRRFITTFIAFVVWWGLVIGHFLNNTRGLT